MKIRALLPNIYQRPTGGNLFNRHVLEYLETVASVERRVIPQGMDHSPPPLIGQTHPADIDVTLIDSLLLHSVANGSEEVPGHRLLISHYLHIFDPDRRASAEAQQERRLLPRIDGVISPSHFCRQVLLREGFTAEQLAVVTPGLKASYRRKVAPQTGAPQNDCPTRILTVSTVLPGKGLEEFLQVLESVADLDWTWELAGDLELEQEFASAFQQRVERSPLRSRIHLHGAVEPGLIVELYNRSHLFALPSRFETCSMATMEAMARGLPLVAFKVGGLTERVPEPNARLLATPGDHQSLAANLRRLLTDPQSAAALGQANRRASKAFPSWKESGEAVWNFVRRTVEENAA